MRHSTRKILSIKQQNCMKIRITPHGINGVSYTFVIASDRVRKEVTHNFSELLRKRNHNISTLNQFSIRLDKLYD